MCWWKFSKLREQVLQAKEDGQTEFCNSDDFLTELSDCYDDNFQDCLHQVKALYLNLDVSQMSLNNVAQTSTPTVDHEDTDQIFEAETMPNVQGNGEATLENE